jgi:hypothetical protein
MGDTRGKYVAPAISETAFNCPHCGALAKQFWFTVHADAIQKDGVPLRIDPGRLDDMTLDHIEDRDERERLKEWARKVAKGQPFMEPENKYRDYDLQNVSISRCFNCNEIAIWIHNSLAWPSVGTAALPNVDLPVDVKLDYEEASTILNLSPRGAAALLRLAIQKLCKELGEKGRNIDDDIAALVKKGLDVRVQQALDVVRVIGNQAVHPGQIDLRDDRATAEKLFGLVNLIAEIMITQPKHIAAMFDGLPEGARKAIERRDNKALPAPD